MTDTEIRAQLGRYVFYHVIPVTETISTAGREDFAKLNPPVLRILEMLEFRGKRVLDVGCRDGLFSLEAEKRGAGEVLGIDNCLSLGAVEFLLPFLKSKVQMREMSLFDLKRSEHGEFDVILFLGVLYHLRYPFLAFKILTELLPEGGKMIIETGIFADDDKRALLFCPTGAESPYEPSSVTFFNRKGLADTLATFGLRIDASDYVKEKHRTQADGTVVRGTFLCTKSSALIDPHFQQYWNGDPHRTWQMPR